MTIVKLSASDVSLYLVEQSWIKEFLISFYDEAIELDSIHQSGFGRYYGNKLQRLFCFVFENSLLHWSIKMINWV